MFIVFILLLGFSACGNDVESTRPAKNDTGVLKDMRADSKTDMSQDDMGTDIGDMDSEHTDMFVDLRQQDASLNADGEDALESEDLANDAPRSPRMGTFSFLIYNVAGLPEGFTETNPDVNIPLMSPKFNAYDIVLVQEDFWYHDDLIAQISLPYLSVPQDANPKVYNLHDGLNRFSKYPFNTLTRTTWKRCYGRSPTGNNDCYARKGFSVAEVILDANGKSISVLVYNLHMDAGKTEGDIDARKAQIEQLAVDIKSRGADQAMIVAGDTNMYFKRSKDVENLAKFLRVTGLSDACDVLQCTDNRIDKVLFKSSSDLKFDIKDRKIPSDFVDANGKDLSDHKPVNVVFSWEEML